MAAGSNSGLANFLNGLCDSMNGDKDIVPTLGRIESWLTCVSHDSIPRRACQVAGEPCIIVRARFGPRAMLIIEKR